MKVKYDKDTQRLVDEAASLHHLLGDLEKVTTTVEALLSAAVMRLPPGSMAGYFAATGEVVS